MIGQSAIEYLMTYGWMLLVVAVVGGAIFATVGDQNVDSVTGFSGGDVVVEDYGVSNEEEIGLEVRSGTGDSVVVSKVNVSDSDTGKYVYKEFTGDTKVDVGSSKIFELPNVSRSDGANSLDVEIIYDTGGLSNLSVAGTVSGSIELTDSGSYEGNPEDDHQSTGGSSDTSQTQFYTDFSKYSTGSIPSDWSRQFSDETSTWIVESNSSYEGGQALVSEDGSEDELIVWDDKNGSDVEILYNVYFNNTNIADQTRAALRASGSQASDSDLYEGGFVLNQSNGVVEKGINVDIQGSATNLASESEYSTGDWWIRFRAENDNLKLKAWPESENEPSNWNLEYTDSNHTSGETGIYPISVGLTEVDEVGVGLEGDSAPQNPVE